MEEFEPVQPRDPNDPTLGATSVPHLPPSSLEIKMRTMASDIESIGKGGGLLGISGKISLSVPREGMAPESNVSADSGTAPKSKTLKYVLLGVGGALVLFAVGYFLPILVSKNGEKPGTVGGGAVATTTGQSQPTAQTGRLTHKTFFMIQPDMVLPILPVESTGLSTMEQWKEAFRFATGTITETQFKNRAGEYLAFSDFLSALGVNFSAKNILQSDFEADFTSFVYKDSAGVWPGIILKLKPGVNALLVGGDVAKFETENNFIDSLFVISPGARDAAFEDAQISGLPVRKLGFEGKPAEFVYGLNSGGYLVIASSEDAFKTALLRL
ncbi:MAG: hypothetical protein LiPW15_735 [Parcubacteria group bacterium LiPW_15]|nr:MAG: hypothetical protein LiPW15_735 [Parcubacteria group bacterium LiPW_15]